MILNEPTTLYPAKKYGKATLVISLASGLEFYDFIIYLLFATQISHVFFPTTNSLNALLASLALFSLGYLGRPLGGIIFSHFGDKHGRKKTFTSSILLMAAATFIIGVLPTYQQLGLAAPLLLLTMRMLQGCALGGEVPGALIYVVEQTPTNKNAYYCALVFVAMNIGIFTASTVSSVLQHLLAPLVFANYGWRIAFWLGGIFAILAYYLRKSLPETAIFTELKLKNKLVNYPFFIVLREQWHNALKGVALSALISSSVTLLYLYLPVYLNQTFAYPLKTITLFNTGNSIFLCITVLLFAKLADKIGSKHLFKIGVVLFILLCYPLFRLLAEKNLYLVVISLLGFSVICSIVISSFAVTLTQLFYAAIRYSGVALSYNLGFAIFGGTAPLIVTYLIHLFKEPLFPAFYLIFLALICGVILFFIKD